MVNGLPVLEIDGVSFRGHGFNATTRTGRYTVPSRRGDNLILPGASGSTFVANKPYEEGEGLLDLFVIGATTSGENIVIPTTQALRQQAFEDNMAIIMRLFTRPHRLSTIRAAAPDGSIRRALVEWKEMSDPTVVAGGTRASFTIAYVIPGVWWEDENTTTQSSTAGAALPSALNLSSFSNMTGFIEDAILTVNGPITNPRLTDNQTGAYVQYAGVVSNGQSWVVDVGAATSKVAGSTVMNNTIHVGGYKLLIVPNEYNGSNTPQLSLAGTGGGGATNFSITARRKWATG